MSNLTVADYKSALSRDGSEGGFRLVYNTYAKKIERHIHYKLSCSCYKAWGRCIDPGAHKTDLTQDTFYDFSDFNNKFYSGEYEKELLSISGLLYKISHNNIYDHLNRRRCTDLPPILTECIDDPDLQLQDSKGSGEIEENLIFKQARESLPPVFKEALDDWIEGFTHEEISMKRGISIAASKKRRSEAIHGFRRFYAK